MAKAPFKIHKVRQYSYFWLRSETLTVEEMTAAVGLEPDEGHVYRERMPTDYPVSPGRYFLPGEPVGYRWNLECHEHGQLDEQVTDLLRRLEPVAGAVRALVDTGNVDAGLMMVRYLDDDEGGYDAMGWALSREQVALIAAMGADIQADEYLDNNEPSAYGYDEE